jgi:hypothetical protein
LLQKNGLGDEGVACLAQALQDGACMAMEVRLGTINIYIYKYINMYILSRYPYRCRHPYYNMVESAAI